MKQLFTSTVLAFIFVQSLFAQVKPVYKEEMRANSEGTFNAIVMELPQTSADKVKDVWESFIKDYKGKTKYSKKDAEFFSDNAKVKEMSDNTIDIYAKIEDKKDKGSELMVWFNFGVTYLSQKEFPKQFDVAKKMLDKFSQKLTSDMLEDLLKAEEKTLKNLENELKDIEKSEEKRKKDIEDYKETIKKMEEKIKEAESDIKTKVEEKGKKKSEIEDQKKKVAEVENDIKKSKK